MQHRGDRAEHAAFYVKLTMVGVGGNTAGASGNCGYTRVWTWVDGELYLPEHWFAPEMAELREKLGIPDEREFETKIELDWKLIQRTHAKGLRFEAICCDDLYGQSSDFRAEMNDANYDYMADVPQNTQVYLKRPVVGVPEAQPGNHGPKPSKPRVLSADNRTRSRKSRMKGKHRGP